MAYNKAREAFAAIFAVTGHIGGTEEPSDILTKPFSPSEFYKHTGPLIFRIISKDSQCYPKGELQN